MALLGIGHPSRYAGDSVDNGLNLSGPWRSLPKIIAVYAIGALCLTIFTSIIIAPVINADLSLKPATVTPQDSAPSPEDKSGDPLIAQRPSYYQAVASGLIQFSWNYKKRSLLQHGWSAQTPDVCNEDASECRAKWKSAQGNPYTLIVHQSSGVVSRIIFFCDDACSPAELQDVFGPVEAVYPRLPAMHPLR